LEFNVAFQHKYGYIRDKRSGVEGYPYPVKEGQRYINLNPGRLFVQYSILLLQLNLQCHSNKFHADVLTHRYFMTCLHCEHCKMTRVNTQNTGPLCHVIHTHYTNDCTIRTH